MKLILRQRRFGLMDNYEVYGTKGKTVYVVEGQLAIGHSFRIYDTADQEVGCVKQKLFTLLPRFDLYDANGYVGYIQKKFSLWKPKYKISCRNWTIQGNVFQLDYRIVDEKENLIAMISRELPNWTDTYSVQVEDSKNAVVALMIALAIDAVKCRRNK